MLNSRIDDLSAELKTTAGLQRDFNLHVQKFTASVDSYIRSHAKQKEQVDELVEKDTRRVNDACEVHKVLASMVEGQTGITVGLNIDNAHMDTSSSENTVFEWVTLRDLDGNGGTDRNRNERKENSNAAVKGFHQAVSYVVFFLSLILVTPL